MSMVEVMVITSSPDNFITWGEEQKLDRYARVMEWHEYVRDLHTMGKLPQVWGTHQLMSAVRLNTGRDVRVSVFRVSSWQEFDQVFDQDPLRDISQHATIPLGSAFDDRAIDNARFERAKEQLLSSKDALGRMIFSAYRSLYNQPPAYVGKYTLFQAENPPTSLDRGWQPGDSLQVLAYGSNPDELVRMWDDTRKFIHYEKVNWFFDYLAYLMHEGKVAYAWGRQDFCDWSELADQTAAGVIIYNATTLDEFGDLYKLDPLRESSRYWSILLQPIADQRRLDAERVKKAEGRLARRTVLVPQLT